MKLWLHFFYKKKILFTDIVDNNETIMNQFIINGNNIARPNIEDINDSFKIIDEYILFDKI